MHIKRFFLYSRIGRTTACLIFLSAGRVPDQNVDAASKAKRALRPGEALGPDEKTLLFVRHAEGAAPESGRRRRRGVVGSLWRRRRRRYSSATITMKSGMVTGSILCIICLCKVIKLVPRLTAQIECPD